MCLRVGFGEPAVASQASSRFPFGSFRPSGLPAASSWRWRSFHRCSKPGVLATLPTLGIGAALVFCFLSFVFMAVCFFFSYFFVASLPSVLIVACDSYLWQGLYILGLSLSIIYL